MRFITPAGENLWLRSIAQPRRMPNSDVVWDGVTIDITRRRQAEEALGEIEQRLISLTTNIPGVVYQRVKHPDGRTTYPFVSSGVREIFGYEPGELMSNPSLFHLDILPRPEDRDTHERTLTESTEMMRPWTWAGQVISRDGTIRWIHISARPRRVRNGAILWDGLILDITQQKEAEAQLRKLSTALEQSPNAVVIADGAGRIEYVNPKFTALTGFEATEVMGKRPGLWLRNDMTPAAYRKLWRKVKAGGEWRGDVQHERKDGKSQWCRESFSAIRDPNGAISNILLILEDITEQKLVEAQLVQAGKLTTLGEMASGLTHELNQPLNIIRMAADSCVIRMEEGEADAGYQKGQFDVISEQTQRMAEIIQHMRIFSRQDRSEVAPFDPIASVHNAISLIGPELRLTNIRLTSEAPPRCRAILGHQVRLEQVIINLLNNAKDAILESGAQSTREHGEPYQGRIDMKLVDDEQEDHILLTVTDTGGGIPQETIEHVFEPFFTTKEVGKGTGLGLSVAYGIISAMHGTMSVRNSTEGACFSIGVPVSELATGNWPSQSQGTA